MMSFCALFHAGFMQEQGCKTAYTLTTCIYQRELSVDNIQLAYLGISRIRASYYKDREGKPLHMYIYLK